MKKQYLWGFFVMMLGFFVGLTSCESSDPSLEAEDGLVSETVPTQRGWSGSTENGICTYAPEVGDDASGYYAFSFKDGVCSDAVYNMVCDSEVEAMAVVEMINKGEFGYDEDEDFSDYSAIAKSPALALSARQLALMKKIILENQKATRADFTGITCSRDGKVVFIKVDCFKNKDGEIVKQVVEAWDSGLNINNLPDAPVFGTYDKATGKYTLENILGIDGSVYEINVSFENDFLKSLKTSVTMPTESWAQMLEESLREQFSSYGEIFGQEPDLKREGKKITVNAAVSGDVERETVENYIIVIDIMMNKPFLANMF